MISMDKGRDSITINVNEVELDFGEFDETYKVRIEKLGKREIIIDKIVEIENTPIGAFNIKGVFTEMPGTMYCLIVLYGGVLQGIELYERVFVEETLKEVIQKIIKAKRQSN